MSGFAKLRASIGAGPLLCRRLWLITPNDNIFAQKFYEKRGYSVAAVHKDAIRLSRKLKPGIPLIGFGGTPIEDEIGYELILATYNQPLEPGHPPLQTK